MATHKDPSHEGTADVPDLQGKARDVPLTEAATAHVRAAASLADNRFTTMRAMVESAIGPLIEANRHIGYDLELTDDEVFRIVEAVRGALDYGSAKIISPIFARGRGEMPYVRTGGGTVTPTLEVEP